MNVFDYLKDYLIDGDYGTGSILDFDKDFVRLNDKDAEILQSLGFIAHKGTRIKADTYYEALAEYIKKTSDNPYIKDLNGSDLKNILSQNYLSGELKDWQNYGGLDFGHDYSYDIQALLSDLSESSRLSEVAMPEAPSYSDIESTLKNDLTGEYADAYSRLDAEEAAALSLLNDTSTALGNLYNQQLAQLNEDSANTLKLYQDSYASQADLFNRSASNLLSNQYQSNAQIYDTLQSDMSKARQNALEAGASAGIRIAGNVNALLTAQNKQSATAMETSNALAEMLLQQRNAAAGLRSEYGQYMSDNAYKRNEAYSNYQTGLLGAKSDYNNTLSNLNANRTSLDTNFRNELLNTAGTQYDRQYQDYMNSMQDKEDIFNAAVSNGNPFAANQQQWWRNQKYN